MAGVDIDFNEDYQRYHITVPNRNERIVIERVSPTSSLFRVRYESGKEIKELNSFFTGKTEAFRAFRTWLNNSKPTKEVLRDEWFGKETAPELKTKKVIRKRKVNEPITSSESN